MKLKTSHLILSLVFPVLTILLSLWLIGGLINGKPLEELNIGEWGLVLTPWVGGVLPIILTYKEKIDTSSYIIDRIIISVISILIFLFCLFIIESGILYVMIVISVLIATFVYFYFRTNNNIKELIVIILSNPTTYYLVLFTIFAISLKEDGLFSGL